MEEDFSELIGFFEHIRQRPALKLSFYKELNQIEQKGQKIFPLALRNIIIKQSKVGEINTALFDDVTDLFKGLLSQFVRIKENTQAILFIIKDLPEELMVLAADIMTTHFRFVIRLNHNVIADLTDLCPELSQYENHIIFLCYVMFPSEIIDKRCLRAANEICSALNE